MPAVHGMHSLAADENNHVYVSWLDERYLKNKTDNQQATTENKSDVKEAKPHHHMEQNREVYFAVSKNGGKSFGANKKLADNACPCCKTATLAAPDGKVYVSWRQALPDDFRHIAVASSNDGGNSFTPTAIVSDDRWQIDGCPVSGAALAAGADGNLEVLWYTAGEAGKPGLYRAESKDGGKTFSPRAVVYEGIVSGTPVLLADKANGFKIVWQSTGKILQMTSRLIPNETAKTKEISASKLPSAAIAADKLFIAFIQNEGDRRNVWLY